MLYWKNHVLKVRSVRCSILGSVGCDWRKEVGSIYLKSSKWLINSIIILSFLFSATPSKSQTIVVKDSSKTNIQLDIRDLLKRHRKKSLKQNTDSIVSKSLGPFNSLLLYPGYALVTSYQAVFTGNISFYTDTLSKRKISSLLFNSLYTANKQWIEIFNSNVWTKRNKFNLLGDWRFYKFPSYTFGLGSGSTLKKSSKIDYSYLRLYEVVLNSVSKNVNIGFGYNLDAHWKITEVNNDSITGISGMDKYGFKTKTLSSGIWVRVSSVVSCARK